jgi:phosphopantothenoylcysteine decarboxylase/phosphopantothenate--cysteine ligase
VETRIVLGITGGIAAYKIPHLIRLLRKNDASVKVVLTRHAMPFVGPETLRTVSGFPVYHDDSSEYDIEHIRLTQWADILFIAPATANTIAKIAHGIADNLLTSIALAFPPAKTIIAPAMNTGMWENSITRENISVLVKRGITVLPVGQGELACGDSGAGRMLEVENLVEAITSFHGTHTPLSGKKVLISSGPTEEPFDPVRVITNRSSGKMGAALAYEALAMGATVTVVTGPAATALPATAQIIAVRTAAEMEAALQAQFTTADICIMAAAVSDYRPKNVSGEKLHRDENSSLTLELIANNDILAELGRRKTHQLLIGFALESCDDETRVLEKMRRKQCDMMVLNLVDKALGNDTTEIVIFTSDGGKKRSGIVPKEAAAKLLLEQAALHWSDRNG